MTLLGKKSFAPLFWTQFLGGFNDNLLKHALFLWVSFQGLSLFGLPSTAVVPLVSAIFILPYFLFSATAGLLADRFDKAGMIRRTKDLELVAMSVGAAGFWFGSPELVAIVLFVMGTQSTLFGPCKYGILPQHLDEEELVTGNALVETATQLAILAGTLVAGTLVGRLEIVAAGIVAVAVLGRVTAQAIPDAPSAKPDLEVPWDPVRPTWELVKLARENRPIWLSILGISWFWMYGAALLSLFPDYCQHVLGGNEDLSTFFLVLFSIGVGLGSMLAGRLSHERVELGIVPIGSFGMLLFTADLAWVGQPWAHGAEEIGPLAFVSRFQGVRIALDLVLLAASSGLLTVPLYALIQQRARKTEKARIIAANNIVNSFWMVVGAVALAVLSALGVTTIQVFWLLAAVTLGVSIYMYTVVREFMLRFATWMLSNVVYRVQAVGLENLPKHGPYLVTPNHVSFIDWFVLLGAIPEPPRVVMDKTIHQWPVLGWLFRQAGTIPIASAKADPETLERAFSTVSQALKEAWVVVIFPEGKVNDDGKMKEFRPGMERILAADPVPVVPVAINGLYGSFFSRKDGPAFTKPFRRRPFSKVILTFGPPIPPAEATAATAEAAVRALWSAHPDLP